MASVSVKEWLVGGGPQKWNITLWEEEEGACQKGFILFYFILFILNGTNSPSRPKLLIIKASWSHSGTPQSVVPLWTSDQLSAETFTW